MRPWRRGGAQVTIQAFLPRVAVLPTKTRPKKLALRGTDGRGYTYLFKGLEDLHLDERIMQFLDVINSILGRRGDTAMRARSYHVVPLGERSGLIQWVDGATPLYTVYKKWQMREYETAKQLATAEAPGSESRVPVPLRPNELFFSKLAPRLKQRDITNVTARSAWPQDVLVEVLGELTRQTPADLITRQVF